MTSVFHGAAELAVVYKTLTSTYSRDYFICLREKSIVLQMWDRRPNIKSYQIKSFYCKALEFPVYLKFIL